MNLQGLIAPDLTAFLKVAEYSSIRLIGLKSDPYLPDDRACLSRRVRDDEDPNVLISSKKPAWKINSETLCFGVASWSQYQYVSVAAVDCEIIPFDVVPIVSVAQLPRECGKIITCQVETDVQSATPPGSRRGRRFAAQAGRA